MGVCWTALRAEPLSPSPAAGGAPWVSSYGHSSSAFGLTRLSLSMVRNTASSPMCPFQKNAC